MQNSISDSKSRRLRSAGKLTDDLISEILARVPYRSLCRFKCVSRSWLALCSSPRMIRRTFSGFFFGRGSPAHFRFVSTSGSRFPLMEGPLLSFLPATGNLNIDIVDSCNRLLLFDRRYNKQELSRYFVCNPATGNWIDLPDIEPIVRCRTPIPIIRLGFDPADSSHFRVFFVVHQVEGVYGTGKVAGVQIYSSETRRWAYRKSRWGAYTFIPYYQVTTAFFNGTLHLTASVSFSSPWKIVTVDKDGKTWGTIPAPRYFQFIGMSRGCFYAVEEMSHEWFNDEYCLSIWALEEYDGRHEWILKHTTILSSPGESYVVCGIHSEDTLIFLTKTPFRTGIRSALVSYDFMNSKEHTIKTLGRCFEEETLGDKYRTPYPYTPCFSKWLLDGY